MNRRLLLLISILFFSASLQASDGGGTGIASDGGGTGTTSDGGGTGTTSDGGGTGTQGEGGSTGGQSEGGGSGYNTIRPTLTLSDRWELFRRMFGIEKDARER